jgi:hypothetical protein
MKPMARTGDARLSASFVGCRVGSARSQSRWSGSGVQVRDEQDQEAAIHVRRRFRGSQEHERENNTGKSSDAGTALATTPPGSPTATGGVGDKTMPFSSPSVRHAASDVSLSSHNAQKALNRRKSQTWQSIFPIRFPQTLSSQFESWARPRDCFTHGRSRMKQSQLPSV